MIPIRGDRVEDIAVLALSVLFKTGLRHLDERSLFRVHYPDAMNGKSPANVCTGDGFHAGAVTVDHSVDLDLDAGDVFCICHNDSSCVRNKIQSQCRPVLPRVRSPRSRGTFPGICLPVHR